MTLQNEIIIPMKLNTKHSYKGVRNNEIKHKSKNWPFFLWLLMSPLIFLLHSYNNSFRGIFAQKELSPKTTHTVVRMRWLVSASVVEENGEKTIRFPGTVSPRNHSVWCTYSPEVKRGALTDRNVILRKKRLIFLMKVADIFNRYSYNDKGLFWNYS